MKIITNNQVVKLSEIHPNNYNPKIDKVKEEQVISQLKKSLQSQGQILPILVRETENGLEIINGYHRFMAMKELGVQEVEVKNLGKLTREEAIKRAINTEEIKNPVDQVELASLLKELTLLEDIGTLSLELPYTPEDLQMKLDMLEFDFSQYEKEQQGKEKELKEHTCPSCGFKFKE